MTVGNFVVNLALLVLLVVVVKEVWWDNRPQVVRRRNDEKLGRAVRSVLEEREQLHAHLQSGVITQKHFEELMARVDERERDACIWYR